MCCIEKKMERRKPVNAKTDTTAQDSHFDFNSQATFVLAKRKHCRVTNMNKLPEIRLPTLHGKEWAK